MERLEDYIDPSWTAIFEIGGFAERMGPIRQVVRPGLQKLAARLSGLLNQREMIVFPHVASHMRRRVNPPHETWLALGPEKRGYKAYGHFGVFIGKDGCSARFVVKDEAEGPKKNLGAWLEKGREVKGWFSGNGEVRDYDAVHGTALPAPALSRTPRELGERLSTLRTSGLDLGWPVPFSMPVEELVGRLERLSPLYRAANGS
jgi:hypothetical protein